MTVAEESTDNAAGADSIPNETNGSVEGSDEFGEKRAKVMRMGSISEAAERAGGLNAPCWLSWFEYPFHVPDPNTGNKLPEACGWSMDAAGRGPLNAVGGYVGTAVLRLASASVGCPNPNNCSSTVFGVKPTSLLTLTSSIVGVIGAVLMPLVGAITDHTRFRKQVGIVSGFFSVILIGMQISVGPNTWFFVLIVDAIQSFALLVHTMAVMAYLPDLTHDEDVLSHYTSRFNIRQFASQLLFVVLVIIVGQIRGTDLSVESSVFTARESTSIAFAFGLVTIGYAWIFLFRKRPKLSEVPEGSNVFNTGFRQVYKSSKKIWKEYRALKWFMISLLWSPEAGAGVVLSMSVTFLVTFMRFSGQDIAIAQVILVSATVIGSLFSKLAVKKINPLNSYRLSLFFLASSVGAGIATFTGPEKKNAVFGWCVAWGFGMGWVYPAQRVLMCCLIPKGQETEMMGLFVFTGQVLGWLPPLIFTIMNQNGVDMRWSLSIVSYFCLLAIICTFNMGSFKAASDQVMSDSLAKLEAVVEATGKNGEEAERPPNGEEAERPPPSQDTDGVSDSVDLPSSNTRNGLRSP